MSNGKSPNGYYVATGASYMQITNINQLLPIVEKKSEFLVMDKGDFTVIDYVYQDSDTFEFPELMECRGIKFDKNGLIIARPFRKFFNYGENGAGLPVHRPHVVTTKLDGSMVHGVRIGKHNYLHTRKGHTDVAKKAEKFVARGDCGHQAFIHSYLNSGYTPIFEFIGPENRIVLRYEEHALIFLAARHMISGDFAEREGAKAFAEQHGVLTAETHDSIEDVPKFIAHARDLEGEEGYVVYFDDGYMVKIKADEYVLIHRALDDMNSKKKVVALCIAGGVDDVIPRLEPADADELQYFCNQFHAQVTVMALSAENIAKHWKDKRKEFALTQAKELGWPAGVVFGIMDGKDARLMIMKALQRYPDDIQPDWRGN